MSDKPPSPLEGVKDCPGADDLSFARLVSLGLSARIFTDTAVQLFGPFLTIFAAGLGVTLVTLGQLVSLRSAVGIIAPVLGILADRHGYRRVLRLELLLASAGLLLIGASRGLWMVVTGLILVGIGTSSFVPTLHAFLSARFPYERRGRGLSIVEYGWALSGVFGLLLMGYAIDLFGWRAPFFVLAAGLALIWFIFGTLPRAPRRMLVSSSIKRRNWPAIVASFARLESNSRSAHSAMLVNALIAFAGLNVFIAYGAWLSRNYGLSTVGLGSAALVVGVADLSGSGLASLIVDRVGKRRSVLVGTAFSSLTFFVLPWFDVGLAAFMVGLMIVRAAFEFSLVCNIPLLSEQVSTERGKVLSQATMMGRLGFSLGTLTGPWIFETLGVVVLSRLSAVSMALAMLVVLFGVREPAQM